MDLRSLDGVSLDEDCAAAAAGLRAIPEGQAPHELGQQADTEEMARTVPLWRDKELRFHIVLRAGIGLAMLGEDRSLRTLADACLAHEAAHVDHEGHLYRTFPEIYGRPVPCGNRSREVFLKAMDVWSEYAACRSSAMFRPEAAQEFDRVFCRALQENLPSCAEPISAAPENGRSKESASNIATLFGDVFVCAGYFFGHVDGLGLDLQRDAPETSTFLPAHPSVAKCMEALQRALGDLWINEYRWTSIEVFDPIYETICGLMKLYGFVPRIPA